MGPPKPGNTPGEVLGPVSPGAKRAEAANPAVRAESPAELGAIDALQLVLDLAGMIPGAGAIPDLINAAISLCRGDFVGALFSAGSAIPVLGDAAGAAKILKNSDKYLEAAKVIEQKVLPMLPKGMRKKLEDYLAKMRAKIDEVMKKESRADASQSHGGSGGKSKGEGKGPGPCDHLKQGNGTGPYRGGAHSKTKGPVNDGKDSHHMPADDVSPLARNDGPAIQMEPADHRLTKSNGSQPGSARYRARLDQLLKSGRWRDAMVKELLDIRRIQDLIGEPGKYNEAMLEMLEYFKCLEKNNLLK